ncbi:sigma-54-dependent transcriptional regulator [Vibrio quintilis]|uniref:sigma-54-dependent transcriptional regulator n=1 Tax=Vibrio quintilis TaxID=1117707 RepID=UPI001356493A|nr:sigma 54-interacting transcriptional regulator [Vibrio quintilis]
MIIESDIETRIALQQIFSSWFSKVSYARNIDEAGQLCLKTHYDLVIFDLFTHHDLKFQAMMNTEFAGSELIICGTQPGISTLALEFDAIIYQPLDTEQIRKVVGRCLERKIESRNNLVLQQDAQKHILASTLIGNSEKTRYLRQLIRQYASSKAAVLIEGELRAGKELTARAIHAAGGRIGPFVPVNCTELKDDASALEKLFGSQNDKTGGRLWLANNGTLFLNSVECLPACAQSALIQLFEHRTFTITHTSTDVLVDIRVIVATTCNLHHAVIEGKFSAELYERLSVLKIHVPPLRERSADLRELFPYLTKRLCSELSLPIPEWIDDHGHFELWDYSWPGNAKELKNLIERCLLLNQSPADYWEEKTQTVPGKSNVVVSVSHSNYIPELSAPPVHGFSGYPGSWSLKEVEQAHIQQVINFHDGNKSAAARELGISRKTLDRKLKEWQSEEH